LEDLKKFSYSPEELLQGILDDRWRSLMRFQIKRAREFYTKADRGISYLAQDARWPVWAASMLYGKILDVIERNDYQVFSQRAYVPQLQKISTLPLAWMRSQVL
jgi:phytoene synthase